MSFIPAGRSQELAVLRARIAQLQGQANEIAAAIEADEPHVVRPVRHLLRLASVEEVVAVLDADGAVIIDSLVPPTTCEAVMAELGPFIDATIPGLGFTGSSTRRTGAVLARSETSWQLVGHPLMRGVCDSVLGRQELTGKAVHLKSGNSVSEKDLAKAAYPWHMHLTQIIEIGPGNAAQPIHQDEGFCLHEFCGDLELEVSTMWALSEFTEENGATRLVPGSHRPGKGPAGKGFRPEDTTHAAMPQGSLLLYLGSCYHGGGHNQSATKRMGLNIDYSVGFLRQEENQYLACPPKEARRLPKEIADIAGYAVGGYALGYVADNLPPIATTLPGFDITVPGSGNEMNPYKLARDRRMAKEAARDSKL